MSYQKALEVAGATILEWQDFGSYQGNWWAKIRYNGKQSWVSGSFGSCSGCDAFESEFGYQNGQCEGHLYMPKQIDCQECTTKFEEYMKRLVDFGNSYLKESMTQQEAETAASVNIEWDLEAEEMLKFLQSNKIVGTDT